MRLLLLVMRFCLAAFCADKNAEALLGVNGHRLKRFFERTHLARFITWCFVKNPSLLIGIGGQSIVIKSSRKPGYVEKYNYTLAGADQKVLHSALEKHIDDQKQLESHFKDLAHPTEFGTASLPLRWPFSKLQTVYSIQEQLHSYTDIFSPEGSAALVKGTSQVNREIGLLAAQTRAWANNNKWLDIIGPNNIVITTDYGKPCIRIIDTGPYAAEYISDSNPVLGRSYRDIFMERLQVIETTAGKTIVVLAILLICVMGSSGYHSSVGQVYAFLDSIEDLIMD
ncbi:MAG TPA: hypothetical protein VLH86_04765 [Patescibacteria group bacterium]|nr:hypothetical protein [Patescibacteria group bacterium]